MNSQELAAATAEFDKPFVADESRSMTPTERAEWNRAKRKRGRPKTGEGFQRIAVSIEKGLLRKVDVFVKKRKLSRSRLFAEALKELMEQEG